MRHKPNIFITPTPDKVVYRDFIVDMLTDTFVRDCVPDTLELIGGVYFKLTLLNKTLLVDTYMVDKISDYVDVYIFSVKQPSDRYTITQVDDDVVLMFVRDITREPADVTATDFIVRAKFI